MGRDSTIRIGALAPLSPPGWVDAGRQLVAGLELAVADLNRAGGIGGARIELLVRDTAADPARAVAAIDELVALGAVALAGEYHSVVARAAAMRADAIGVPYLCSSAVLDALTDAPTDWVARLPPPQSRGWAAYADFLLDAGHGVTAIAAERSAYWAAGTGILTERIESRGGRVLELDPRVLDARSLCSALAGGKATALVLLIGDARLAHALVAEVRGDARLEPLLLCAPAGQPELQAWFGTLGARCASIPFLRYLPDRLTALGRTVDTALQHTLQETTSFVAFEGYDTILALAAMLGARADGSNGAGSPWKHVVVNATRGVIRFSRANGSRVWQWHDAPLQIAARDAAAPDRFQVLRQVG
jgi:hypothetical protein